MKTITRKKEAIYSGNLLLVNQNHPLRNRPEYNLVPAMPGFPAVLLNRDAANILQMILGRIAAGGSIIPVSGYRSEQEQAAIYAASLADNGEKFTKQFVALPNCSEHQTGLAIDLGINQDEIDFICPDFPYEGICQSFRKEAPNYGFIERYAKEKEAITGISHEPWHFRYVGFPHSKIIWERKLALEEYIEFIKAYHASNRLVYQQGDQTEMEIYYIPADDGNTCIPLPENSVYQISGNNTDGFIVTIYDIFMRRKNNE